MKKIIITFTRLSMLNLPGSYYYHTILNEKLYQAEECRDLLVITKSK